MRLVEKQLQKIFARTRLERVAFTTKRGQTPLFQTPLFPQRGMKARTSRGMWAEGEVVTRREVLNHGRCWASFPVVVIRDEPGLLVTYVEEGTPFTFPP